MNPLKLIPWRRVVWWLAGVGLLLALLDQQGFTTIGGLLQNVVPLIGTLTALSLLTWLFQALSWNILSTSGKISWPTLFRLKIGGDALDRLSSIFPIRGSTYQVAALRTSSGIPDASDLIIIDHGIHSLLLVFAAKLFRGFLSPAVRGEFEEKERLIRSFAQKRPARFYLSLLFHLIVHACWMIEIWIVGRALIPSFSFLPAMLFYAIAFVVVRIFTLIPGAFGVLEILLATLLLIFYGPSGFTRGLTLQLVRRLRALAWIVVGLGMVGNPFNALKH